MEAQDCTAFLFIQTWLVEDESLSFSRTTNHLISFMEQLNKWAQSGVSGRKMIQKVIELLLDGHIYPSKSGSSS